MIEIKRKTTETDVVCVLAVGADGAEDLGIELDSGLPFLDHMLEQLCVHAGWRCRLQVQADYAVDDHHGIEDVAICLGRALREYWVNGGPWRRYGQRLLPMDEALTLCAVDLCDRPYAVIDLPFTRDSLGGIGTEMWAHFFYTLAINAGINLHLKNLYFSNNHHLIESAFKAMAWALAEALQADERLRSSKGALG